MKSPTPIEIVEGIGREFDEFVSNGWRPHDDIARIQYRESVTKIKSFITSKLSTLIDALIEEIESTKRDEYGLDVPAFRGTAAARNHNRSYNSALFDTISRLQELKSKIK